jgi:predicted nucleotidyltransferase component of viral defense system
MILRSEINRIAREQGVPPSTIDKDWVLSHVLAALFRQDWARETLLFKGGTCLKKCYFPGYRFSEDIDFTILKEDFLLTQQVVQQVIVEITEKTGIRFAPFNIQPIVSRNRLFGYTALLKFRGADHRNDQEPPENTERWHTMIKVEMTWHELILFPVEMPPIHHPYSDSLQVSAITVPCYHLFEVMAEKLRATIQRSYPAPRDYYDLWYLLQNLKSDSLPEIIHAFREKAAHKGIPNVNFSDLFQTARLSRSERAWNQSLGSHLPPGSLSQFSHVIEELQTMIRPYFL